MNDCGVQIMKDVSYIPKLRKNLISVGTLHANGFFYKSDGHMDIMKVGNEALIVMKVWRNACKIYKLLGNNVVGKVAVVEFNNDAIKL